MGYPSSVRALPVQEREKSRKVRAQVTPLRCADSGMIRPIDRSLRRKIEAYISTVGQNSSRGQKRVRFRKERLAHVADTLSGPGAHFFSRFRRLLFFVSYGSRG